MLPGSLVTWLRSPLQLLVSAAESSRGEATCRLCTHLLVGDGVEGPLPEGGSGCRECGWNADRAQDVWAREESGSHPSSDAPAPEARCGAHASVTVQGVMDAGGPRRKHRPVAMLAVSSPPSAGCSSGPPSEGVAPAFTGNTAWRLSTGNPDFPAVTAHGCLFRRCLPGTEFSSTWLIFLFPDGGGFPVI